MAPNPFSFPSLLRELLVRRCLTPGRLADVVGVRSQTVESWLSGARLPTAASVWAAGRALGADRRELLLSGLSWYHARQERLYPENIDHHVKFERSSSAYFGGLQGIPETDREQFLRLWRSILEERSPFFRSPGEETIDSELIVLPKPKIVVIDEWAEIITHIAKDASQLYQLDWKRFEDLVARLLERYGWQTRQMGYTKDDGIDIIAVNRVTPDIRFTMMVQCKRLSKERRVGIATVREVWSVKWEKGFHHAMIATTSRFTRGAKQKGEKWDLALTDHDAIVEWCRDLQLSNSNSRLAREKKGTKSG